MRYVPVECPGSLVDMLRMIASLSVSRAMFGRYSQTRVPGTRLGTERKTPWLGRPDFMSNVSRWLAPPAIHRRMQRLPRRWASAAIDCEPNRPPQLGTARPPAPTRAPLSRERRDRWSAGLQRIEGSEVGQAFQPDF